MMIRGPVRGIRPDTRGELMKSRKRTTRFVSTSFVIALALVAAACGSDSDKSSSSTAAAVTTAAPTTAAPTTAAATTAPAATTAETSASTESTESTGTESTATDDSATATTEASTDTTEAAPESNAKAATPEEWDAIIAKAKEEGSVTIYSSQGLDQLNDMAKRFEDEYGIHVEVVRAIDADLLAKVQAEQETGTGIGDVLAQATASWTVEKSAAGWFTPFVGPAMDNPDYNKALNVSPNGDYFVSTSAVLTFGWNTELWPDGLTDYTDLLDPGLADGKVGVIEPAAGSIVDFYLYLEEKYGEDFITKLAAQKPRIYPSSLPMAQALTAGEISAASFVQVLSDEKANGAPVESGLSDTVWGALFQTSVLATSPHPNAAQLLANFMITPEGQEAIARKAGAALPNIEGSVTLTDKVRRQDIEKLTPEFVAEYQQKWDALFTG